MKTKTITESPLFTLTSSDYNGDGENINIFAADLKAAKIGDIFSAEAGSCARAVREERLTVVFKNNDGCACVLHVCGTENTPNVKEWEDEDTVIWFQLH